MLTDKTSNTKNKNTENWYSATILPKSNLTMLI